MKKILISACLLGNKVRYDGRSLAVSDRILERWLSEGRVVSVCPEVEGGLGIPRQPAEILAGSGEDVLKGEADVVGQKGHTLTREFLAGASAALELCRQFDIDIAVLAELSPSCGSSAVYDGSFSGRKIAGMGVTAALLRQNGVQVFSQYEIADADALLHGKNR